MKKIALLSILLINFMWIGISASESKEGAILAATIQALPAQPFIAAPGKFQPGNPVKLSVKVSNLGKEANPPATVFLQFVFPKPLDAQPQSLLFKTEKATLPMIPPGQNVDVAFSTQHHWPALLDFIRDDWSMREYQAIVVINDSEHLIGTRSIAVSAHYYEGPNHEFPTEIQNAK